MHLNNLVNQSRSSEKESKKFCSNLSKKSRKHAAGKIVLPNLKLKDCRFKTDFLEPITSRRMDESENVDSEQESVKLVQIDNKSMHCRGRSLHAIVSVS